LGRVVSRIGLSATRQMTAHADACDCWSDCRRQPSGGAARPCSTAAGASTLQQGHLVVALDRMVHRERYRSKRTPVKMALLGLSSRLSGGRVWPQRGRPDQATATGPRFEDAEEHRSHSAAGALGSLLPLSAGRPPGRRANQDAPLARSMVSTLRRPSLSLYTTRTSVPIAKSSRPMPWR